MTGCASHSRCNFLSGKRGPLAITLERREELHIRRDGGGQPDSDRVTVQFATRRACHFQKSNHLHQPSRCAEGLPKQQAEPAGVARAGEQESSSLVSSLGLSQHHGGSLRRRFVIPHQALRLVRLVWCEIMRPTKSDRLKPQFRLDLERSRSISG